MFSFESSPSQRIEKAKVVITGGTEGIGRGIAEEFIENSVPTAICARSEDKISEIKNIYSEHTSTVIAEKVDLSDRHAAKHFIAEAITELNGLDTLILNAAAFDFSLRESGLDTESIKSTMFKTNVVANITLIKSKRSFTKVMWHNCVSYNTFFG
jgi:NADP-dependent 3-hydroxy acid dehydrogenase YdfG